MQHKPAKIPDRQCVYLREVGAPSLGSCGGRDGGNGHYQMVQEAEGVQCHAARVRPQSPRDSVPTARCVGELLWQQVRSMWASEHDIACRLGALQCKSDKVFSRLQIE